MVPDRVDFTGLVVENPRLVLAEHPPNRSAFWPLTWTLVPEPGTLDGAEFLRKPDTNYPRWLRKNCGSRYDYIIEDSGRRIFAFESVDEALLFKLTF